MKQKKLIFNDPIADTLLIPLFMRAEESQKSDRLFEDKDAKNVIKQLPFDFSPFKNKRMSQTGTAIRVSLFDNIARQCLNQAENPVLVHLGCGLDNRFNRTDTGKGIHINIDLPEFIEWQNQLYSSQNERNISFSGSILETDWMDKLLKQYPDHAFSFFIEGVLIYFPETQVKQFFNNLMSHFSNVLVCFDSCTNWIVKHCDQHDTVRMMRANFKWGIDNPQLLESWSPRLKHIKTISLLKQHPKRWGFRSVFRLFPPIAKGCNILIYQITD